MPLEPFHLEVWLAEHPARWDFSTTGMGACTGEQLGLTLDLTHLNLGYGELSGSLALRTVLAQRYPIPDPDRILVTQGAIEANLLVMTALLQAGDQVVTFTPGYQQFSAWPRFLGCGVQLWPLSNTEMFGEGELAPDLDFLSKGRTPRLLILNHPHNPTGKRFDWTWLQAVLTWADREGCWVLVDEVYRDLQPGGPARQPSVATLGGKRVVVTDSFAKSLGLPGLRIGWVSGPPDLLQRCRRIKDYLTISPAQPSQALALQVLGRWEQLWPCRYQDYQQARQQASALLPRIPQRQGGAMAWVRCATPATTCKQLWQQGFVVVPGTCFGNYPALRIGLGNLDRPNWVQALGAVVQSLNKS
ncbi:pyridoxal phosphate-dependent aminotransferase [Candidatus Cyanaurora vandensis]|uniref:pyridoxal phosphate-dependent aminotransferase n=1 Tax=Candidatus Cyanaurora vandensis TaxID=2714958 RepID=UPI00257C4DCB|nr:pyridoxal phosphate-dependent aminotransferase [Candidatus Cyanaurora vandensis]